MNILTIISYLNKFRYNGIEVKLKKFWPFIDEAVAVTLPPFVFYKGEPSESTKVHEQSHIKQARKYTIVGFYFMYLWYSIKYRFIYTKHPFEIEAFKAEEAWYAEQQRILKASSSRS